MDIVLLKNHYHNTSYILPPSFLTNALRNLMTIIY
nr:MAG TPA: hypothetical protein [Caudoviricetes sp.]